MHGLTKEQARAELVYTLNKIDSHIQGVLVIHGYHQGVILKNFIRKEFQHINIKDKINIDASRTLLLVKLERKIEKN